MQSCSNIQKNTMFVTLAVYSIMRIYPKLIMNLSVPQFCTVLFNKNKADNYLDFL